MCAYRPVCVCVRQRERVERERERELPTVSRIKIREVGGFVVN